jgi:hypothetical protein
MIPEHDPVVIPVKLSGEVRSVRLKEQDVEPRVIAAIVPEIDHEPEAPLLNPDDIEAPKGNWGTIYGRIIGDQATVKHRPAILFKANPARRIPQDIPAEDLKVNAKTGGVENVFIWMV